MKTKSLILILTLFLTTFSDQKPQQQACIVTFNTQSHKYHNPNCKWALKCTQSCIKTTVDKAKNRGGIPCKICHGGCI